MPDQSCKSPQGLTACDRPTTVPLGACMVQVRAHAVEVLKRTEDEELLYYLLQLVQALRYEEANDSPLAQFLVQRAVANPTLAFTLHWC